jgi:ABC-type dipeptide/oligopeptide/nickel transport system permease component
VSTGRLPEIAIRLELSLQVAIMASILPVLSRYRWDTAALMRGTWVDAVRIIDRRAVQTSFWFGMLIMITLLYLFNWLPPITFTPSMSIANLTQLIWPALAVGYLCAVVARDPAPHKVLSEDYITARARACSRMVISRHALRNACCGDHRDRHRVRLPDRQAGRHRAGVQSQRHRHAVRAERLAQRLHADPALDLLVASAYVVINLVVDLLYAVFDPRVVQLMSVAALPSTPVLPRRRAILRILSPVAARCSELRGDLRDDVHGIFAGASLITLSRSTSPASYRPRRRGPALRLWPRSSRASSGSRTAIHRIHVAFIGSTLGAIIGVASAYFGGKIDDWIQRFVDILLAFPIIVLALVVVAALRKFIVAGIDVNLIYAIAIPIVPRVARVVRAAALSIRVMPYVDASRAAGYSNSRIIFRHMARIAPYLIMFTAFIAQAILLGLCSPSSASA